MESYRSCVAVHLIDMDNIAYETTSEQEVKAAVTPEGYLQVKVIVNGDLVGLVTYHGKFLIEWKVEA